MDNLNLQYDSIKLKWNLNNFLPIKKEVLNNNVINEILYLGTFDNAHLKSYWSISEKLIDIRWLMNQINSREGKTNNVEQVKFISYLELEFYLQKVVSKIGNIGYMYYDIINDENINNLFSEIRIDEFDYIYQSEEYWKKAKRFWTMNSNLFCSFSKQNTGENYRKFDFDILYKVLTKNIVNIKNININELEKDDDILPLPNEIYSIAEIMISRINNGMSHMEIDNLVWEFSDRIINFFNMLIIFHKNKLIRKIRKLEELIKSIIPSWKSKKDRVTSSTYIASIYDGVQGVADQVSDTINTISNNTLHFNDLFNNVKNAITLLKVNIKNTPRELNEYINDHGRCIAMLEIQNKYRYIAFSGFYDYDNTYINNISEYKYDDNIVKTFQEISEKLNARLCILSKNVVNKISRYNIDEQLNFKKVKSLENELSAPQPIDFSLIKKYYACCERKILASISTVYYKPNKLILCRPQIAKAIKVPNSAFLAVKFMPCMNCYCALKDWKDKYNIDLHIDYPR